MQRCAKYSNLERNQQHWFRAPGLWRLYSPEFRAALADRRAAIWGTSADRLRSLLPKALDTLAEALETGDDKVTVALAVLKLAGPHDSLGWPAIPHGIDLLRRLIRAAESVRPHPITTADRLPAPDAPSAKGGGRG